jgi:hypothetical protein
MPSSSFTLGQLVNVASRTTPGINKPGGVGKVTNISYEDGVMLVDVEYVLGGKEKSIELEFVAEHSFNEENHGRSSRVRRSRVIEEPVKPVTTTKKKAALKDASSDNNKKKSEKKSVSKSESTGTRKAESSAKKSTETKVKKNTKEQTNKKPQTKKAVKKSKSSNVKEEKSRAASPPQSAVGNSVPGETPSRRISGFIRNVYSDVKNKAATFVETVVGANDDNDGASSPDSTGSLQLDVDTARLSAFNSSFFEIMRSKMIDCIEITELTDLINQNNQDKDFSELEMRTYLEKLDAESKVMVTWDTGTIYIL